MPDDITDLERLNIEIGDLESAANAPGLAKVLAAKIAFRRADGTIDERGTVGGSQLDGVLDKVKPPGTSRATEIESITFYPQNRAVVTCIVTMPRNPPNKKYHNVRLFIREKDGWKLLGWANEEIP